MDLNVFIFTVVLFALLGAAIGNTRGRGVAGFFFGLLLGPIGWIIILAGPNYKEAAKQKENSARATTGANIDALAKLAELKEKGILTEEEFLAKKKELLKQ
jgi:uncharacterized membrane protein